MGKPTATDHPFPPSFAWGTSTSAPQSEGGLEHSDWRIWERSGHAPESGRCSDKAKHYDEDFSRLAELGLTHHLTSLEWSRMEPEKGLYNRAAIDQYRAMMETASLHGITLWIALHNVTLPAWFARMGGFMDEPAFMYWHRYVELVAKELGRLADYWIPILNPVLYAAGAYLLGKFPPGKQRLDKFSQLLVRLHLAHGNAYQILKTYLPQKAEIGMASLVAPIIPNNPDSDADHVCADFIDGWINQPSLDALLSGTLHIPGKGAVEISTCRHAADFFGINYFFPLLVSKQPLPNENSCLHSLAKLPGMPALQFARPGRPRTDHGYEAFPEGIYLAAKRVHAAGLELPLYLTAAGIATRDENFRTRYIADSLTQLQKALEQGINLRGYFYYSDVDTYEWDKGFSLNYGLFAFDPLSLERKPRPAAELLSQAARRK